MATIEEMRLLLSLLEKFEARQMDAHRVLAEWPLGDSEDDKALTRVWHHLYHFASDAEIQQKDARYEAYQIDQIRKDINALREKLSHVD